MITVTVKGVANFADLLGTGEPRAIAVPEGTTLRDLVTILVEEHGAPLAARIFSESGELRKDFRPLLNGRDLFFLNGLNTVLKDGDRFTLMPFLAGG
jgi:molybdopterin synthase sulfur carrier subunit